MPVSVITKCGIYRYLSYLSPLLSFTYTHPTYNLSKPINRRLNLPLGRRLLLRRLRLTWLEPLPPKAAAATLNIDTGTSIVFRVLNHVLNGLSDRTLRLRVAGGGAVVKCCCCSCALLLLLLLLLSSLDQSDSRFDCSRAGVTRGRRGREVPGDCQWY